MKVPLSLRNSLYILFSIIACHTAAAQGHGAAYYKPYRKLMAQGLNNAAAAKKLQDMLAAKSGKDGLEYAYLGTAQAMIAKNAWNPITKIAAVKHAQGNLNKAVQINGHDLQIRFLRFTLDYYTPAFLPGQRHLAEDKAKMLALLHEKEYGVLDAEDVANTARFLIKSKQCTPTEVSFLKQLAL